MCKRQSHWGQSRPSRSVVKKALPQGVKVPGDVFVFESSRSDAFKGMKEEQNRFLEEVNGYSMEERDLIRYS